MKFVQHNVHGSPVAELVAPNVVFQTAQEFLQMMMDSSADAVIIHQHNINERFFDLRSGLAGDMLQKVVNYRLRLAIVGEFDNIESKNLKAFILESNRSGTIVFVNSVESALVSFGK